MLFALSAFIGAQIRFTSVIAAIACLIAALFESRIRLAAWLAVPLALVFVAGSAAVNAENARHLGAENIEKYTLPKLHYIAMGLPVQSDEGYGQYGYGGWLVFSTSFDDPQERDAALLREVIDRIYYLRYPSRLLNMMSRKNLSTFGDGTFRLNEIIEGDVRDPDNLVKQFVFAPGKYYPALLPPVHGDVPCPDAARVPRLRPGDQKAGRRTRRRSLWRCWASSCFCACGRRGRGISSNLSWCCCAPGPCWKPRAAGPCICLCRRGAMAALTGYKILALNVVEC